MKNTEKAGGKSLWGRWDVALVAASLILQAWFTAYRANPPSQNCAQGENKLEMFRVIPREGKTFGADVYGFDPVAAMGDETLANVLKLHLEKHLVLVLHNVTDKMTPEMQVRLSKMFGPTDPVVSSPPKYLSKGGFNSPDAVKRAQAKGISIEELGKTMLAEQEKSRGMFPRELTRIVKYPDDSIAFGEGAHTDLSFYTAPPFLSMLASRKLPSKGGNTWFWDMRAAYDALPENVKTTLIGLRANHTDGHDNFAIHPAVRSDNKYGRLSLFVNKAFTRHFVWGDRPDYDPDLLGELFEFIDNFGSTHPQAHLDITWSPGQITMWDNRFTQHAAQNDYNELREMHRTVVSGTIPF